MTKRSLLKLVCLVLALLLVTTSASALRVGQDILLATNEFGSQLSYNATQTKNLEKFSNGISINRASNDTDVPAYMWPLITRLRTNDDEPGSTSPLLAAMSYLEGADDWEPNVPPSDLPLLEDGSTCQAHPDEPHVVAGCGAHYACEEGKHGYALCGLHLLCDATVPDTGHEAADCSAHHQCQHEKDFDCGTTPIMGMLDNNTGVVGLTSSDGQTSVLVATDTEDGLDLDQFATDGGHTILGSDNPEAVVVGSKGDVAIVGVGKAFVGAYDGSGQPIAGWNLYSNGATLYVATANTLEITLDGKPITTLTLQTGETAQLSMQEIKISLNATKAISLPSDNGIEWPYIPIADVAIQFTSDELAASVHVDMTNEIEPHTNDNILSQAAQTMLSQANTEPQSVPD